MQWYRTELLSLFAGDGLVPCPGHWAASWCLCVAFLSESPKTAIFFADTGSIPVVDTEKPVADTQKPVAVEIPVAETRIPVAVTPVMS